jgi:hypothetical protein
MAIEKPEYTVELSSHGIEVRNYSEYWIAECHVSGETDLSAAGSRAFGRLFGYISGENSQGQKIAMTSPVQQIQSETGWNVSFVVPKDVSVGEIPVPSNSTIAIRKVDAGRFAVLQYSGTWSDSKFKAKTALLLNAVSDLGMKTAGTVSSAFYNPPFTPPFLRRNEVMVRLQT